MKSRRFFFNFNILKCLVFGCCCWLSTASVPSWFFPPSEHREPTEAHPPWGPGTLSDGWGCALPPRQSPPPLFSCRHPCSLASSSRSPSVCVAMNAPPPRASMFTDCLCFQPKLGMAKCRRNVENFLEACRKMGVPEVRPPSALLFQCSHSLFLLSTGDLFLVCFYLWYSPQWTFVSLGHESVKQLAPWAANAAILPSIKLLVTALLRKSIEGNQIEVQQDTRTIYAVPLFFVASHNLQNKYNDCFCAVQWKK